MVLLKNGFDPIRFFPKFFTGVDDFRLSPIGWVAKNI
ncbi:MAG: hypothetical protein ACI85U_002667 [Candidatus Promineifilaceae bacterium]|jgi:hypothetical protein